MSTSLFTFVTHNEWWRLGVVVSVVGRIKCVGRIIYSGPCSGVYHLGHYKNYRTNYLTKLINIGPG